MSCWVAPTLAAEIWQIPLELLMSRIRSGEIPVRDEDGFQFVDVAPFGPRVERPHRATPDRPPMSTPADAGESATVVTDAKAAALASPAVAAADDENEMGPEDNTASVTLGDWRTARRKTGRTRLPPPRRPAA
ncbi:MAG: hypothetical protein QOE14_1481 [Humisphaera sp.]|nr:hypothetical protein [Humisphaera sp.]